MMKREELSRIASVKFKKAITDCSHAVSHRVLAFCVMAACLVFTLAVTAANLRLTYVTDSTVRGRWSSPRLRVTLPA